MSARPTSFLKLRTQNSNPSRQSDIRGPVTCKGSPGVTYNNAKTRLTRLTHKELQTERPGGILNLLCVCATCTGTDWKLAEGGVDPSTVARDLDIVDLPAGTHIVCMHNLNYFYCIATSAIV
jgi:hypothetical protein